MAGRFLDDDLGGLAVAIAGRGFEPDLSAAVFEFVLIGTASILGGWDSAIGAGTGAGGGLIGIAAIRGACDSAIGAGTGGGGAAGSQSAAVVEKDAPIKF